MQPQLPKVTFIPADRIIGAGLPLFEHNDYIKRVDDAILNHVRHNRRQFQRRWYAKFGGLHMLRLGRLTIQWSWRTK